MALPYPQPRRMPMAAAAILLDPGHRANRLNADMPRPDAGLTLIELLFTTAILAIGLTLGVPAMQELIQAQRVRATLFQLTGDFALARSIAIARRTQVVLCPGAVGAGCRDDHDWSHGWILFEDPDKARQPGAPEAVLRAVQHAPAGLSVTSSRPYLRYQRDGRSANSNLTLRICSKGRLHGLVVVNNSGRARTERPARPPTCPTP